VINAQGRAVPPGAASQQTTCLAIIGTGYNTAISEAWATFCSVAYWYGWVAELRWPV